MHSDNESSKDKQTNQNYDGDDLIFSGSGCFDDEDECANYADAGSGYDDLIITPVYVPIKPTPISQPKTNSKANKNKANANKQRAKCTATALEEQANRVQRTEDDDNEEDDEEDDEDCGSGANYDTASSNSEETTERNANSVDQINNNEVYPYQLSTEQSNVINPVTIDDDDKSILYTSQPIPPPASELEKIVESTTRRPPPPPKRPGGHIEIGMRAE